MIVILMLIAIIIGYIRRGKIRNLSNIRIKMIPLLILAFLLQGGIYLGYAYDVSLVQDFDILIHFISYIFLFAALMSNFDNKWFVVMAMGMILNFLVIFLNGGKMPVSLEAVQAIGLGDGMDVLFARRAGTHQPLEEGMLLWFLADVIPLSLPGVASILNNIYSAGDFFIYGGAMGLIQWAMKSEKKQEIEENLDELLEEEAFSDQVVDSLFDEEVGEEEIARLRELRKRREEETRRIFQREAEQYFQEEQQEEAVQADEMPQPEEELGYTEEIEEISLVEEAASEEMVETIPEEAAEIILEESAETPLVVEDEETPDSVTEDMGETIAAETVVPEEETPVVPEEEHDWKIYTQDFSNAELLGTSMLEEQIIRGENYTQKEPAAQSRKYYTKPLHERMVIDLESDGYDWLEKEEEAEVSQEEQEVRVEPEEEKAPAQPVDVTHPFIIVDGRIVENPNYRKPNAKPPVSEPMAEPFKSWPEVKKVSKTSEEEKEEQEPKKEEEIIAPVNGWTLPDEEAEVSGNILQKLDDEDRINLMKKMKERKEKGYSLVQVKVGDKTITFWKKDL